MALPPLTPEQRAAALKKASESRTHRAEVKESLKKRQISLSEVLKQSETDDAIAKMKVKALLESLPRVGVTTATVLMEEIGISPARRVRGLGHHQRDELIRRFG